MNNEGFFVFSPVWANFGFKVVKMWYNIMIHEIFLARNVAKIGKLPFFSIKMFFSKFCRNGSIFTIDMSFKSSVKIFWIIAYKNCTVMI